MNRIVLAAGLILTTASLMFAQGALPADAKLPMILNVLPVMGNLAMEIFFGPSLVGRLRVSTREAVEGVFCRF